MTSVMFPPQTAVEAGFRIQPRPDTVTAEPCAEREWMALVEHEMDGMFQIALLLTCSARAAEDAVAGCLDDIDICSPPGPEAPRALQRQVVLRCLHRHQNSHVDRSGAHSVLQERLWPILEMSAEARACFVLCLLLQYTAAECARLTRTGEARVVELLHAAAGDMQKARQTR